MRRSGITALAVLLATAAPALLANAPADAVITGIAQLGSTVGGFITGVLRPSRPVVDLATTPASPAASSPVVLGASTGRRQAVLRPSSAPPRAAADTYSTARGTTLIVTAATGVLANDSDPQGKSITAISVANPSHGSLTLNSDGSFAYVNDGSSAATDSFTYRASNGTTQSSPAVVTITITGDSPALAVDDSYPTGENTSLTVPAPGLLSNDTINNAKITSYGASSGTEQKTIGSATPTLRGGSVTVSADGGFNYSPQLGFTGSDTFSYTITNTAGSSAARVTLGIATAPPVATDDSYSAQSGTTLSVPPPGVFANDSFIQGSIAGYGSSTGMEQTAVGSSTATAQAGTVSLNSNGSFSYTSAAGFSGNDSFKYTLRNDGGSSTATVTIAVQAVSAATLTVTSPGFFYSISGFSGQNPVITLQRGKIYTFQINTDPIHPFEILNAPPGTVTNNNISSGTITFVVPAAAASYRYHCSVHNFGNVINTTP